MGNSEFFIDWVSAVLDFNFLPREGGTIPIANDVERRMVLLGISGQWVACKPRFGYELAWRHSASGAILQTCRTREDMGVNFVGTGEPLRILGWGIVVALLCRAEARFTRVDLSVDVFDTAFDIGGLYREVDDGLSITRSKRHSMVVSGVGTTVYIGSRSSEKFLRVYDKGAEQGDEAGCHFRIELECKGNAANFAAYSVNDRELNDFREVIMGFFDAPGHPGWCRAMEGVEEAHNIPSTKKRPNFEEWMFGFVASQVAKAEEANPGFFGTFVETVERILAS